MSTQTIPSIISGVRNATSVTQDVASPRSLPSDEVVNTITHGIGIPLSLAGSALLLSTAMTSADVSRLVGCVIYAVTLVGVFTASTLSHCFVCTRRRNFYRSLDQALIYLLIVGSYTPFSVAYLHGTIWQCQLALMWAIAIAGFVSKIGFSHRINSCRIWSYVVLAFLGSIPAFYQFGTVPLALHGWVLLGGAAFLLGVVFYLLDVKRYHFHAMWHLLVIAGCGCHFMAIYLFVALGG